MVRNLYIVLTNTNSILSKAIKLYTGDLYNHISISFEENLEKMYSFGRVYENIPFIGGFIVESKESKLIKNSECAILRYEISDVEYYRINRKIKKFIIQKEKYKYNFMGLLAYSIKYELNRENAYFCSEFVTHVIKESGIKIIDKKPIFTKPSDYLEIGKFGEVIFVGKMKDYI